MPAKYSPIKLNSFYHTLEHALSEASLVDESQVDEASRVLIKYIRGAVDQYRECVKLRERR